MRAAFGDVILVVAAHPDDEVLGCGGTMARLVAEGCEVHLLVLADGEGARSAAVEQDADDRRRRRRQAANDAAGILGVASVTTMDFADNRMDRSELLDVVKAIERKVTAVRPQTVFTHHDSDVNIDHRVTYDAVLAACRPLPGACVRQLLFFEVPSSTEWRPAGSGRQFVPNCFIDVETTLELKLRAAEAYREEMRPFPHPRSREALEALARWRGATCGMEAAEAFCVGRLIL